MMASITTAGPRESIMIFAVLLWVVCAGVAAFIANAKGRDAGVFALAGFLLGPFGVVWAAFARTGVERAADDLAALNRMRKTPW